MTYKTSLKDILEGNPLDMATSKDYSRSVIAASDELMDIYCEPCVDEGKQIEAEGFCVDCSEYLCGQCYKHHTRYKAFKHHVLQGKDKMPLVAAKTGARDVCVEKCAIHQTKIIEYFCKSCDTLGCHACTTVDHRQCQNVDHIPNIVKDLEQSEEFKEFITKLDKKLEAVNKRQKKFSSSITETDEMKKKAKAELKNQREEINKFFDYLEEEMDRRIEDIDKKNKENIKAATSTSDSIQSDLKQMKVDVETKQQKGQKCELFIGMKNNKPRMEKVVKEFEKENYQIQGYTLTPSLQLKDVIKNTTEICKLTTAEFVSEINVDISNDKEKSWIRGLAVIQNHFLVVLDGKNNKVKVIDTNIMKVTSDIDLNCDYVWGITAVNNDKIAVVISPDIDRDIIQCLSVSKSGSLSKGHQIYTDECFYLAYRRENFIISDYPDVKIINMQGKTLKTIETGELGGIAISKDNSTIYMTSPTKNTVTSMTLDGKVKTVYKDKDLESPCGITVDEEGLVYVLGSDNIHQLTGDLNKIQVLLDNVYGSAITHSNATNSLYVSKFDTVKVYQLQ